MNIVQRKMNSSVDFVFTLHMIWLNEFSNTKFATKRAQKNPSTANIIGWGNVIEKNFQKKQ